MIVFNQIHYKYMQIAFNEAQKAYKKNEIPVGAVIANNNQIIAKAHNTIEETQNPLMHAEILVINKACQQIGQKFLDQYNIYITLEPCSLCMQAISIARISKIFFATSDSKKHKYKTSNIEIYEGLLKEESKSLLDRFFFKLREKN